MALFSLTDLLTALQQQGNVNAQNRARADAAAARAAQGRAALAGLAAGIGTGVATGGNPYLSAGAAAAASKLAGGNQVGGAEVASSAAQALSLAQQAGQFNANKSFGEVQQQELEGRLGPKLPEQASLTVPVAPGSPYATATTDAPEMQPGQMSASELSQQGQQGPLTASLYQPLPANIAANQQRDAKLAAFKALVASGGATPQMASAALESLAPSPKYEGFAAGTDIYKMSPRGIEKVGSVAQKGGGYGSSFEAMLYGRFQQIQAMREAGLPLTPEDTRDERMAIDYLGFPKQMGIDPSTKLPMFQRQVDLSKMTATPSPAPAATAPVGSAAPLIPQELAGAFAPGSAGQALTTPPYLARNTLPATTPVRPPTVAPQTPSPAPMDQKEQDKLNFLNNSRSASNTAISFLLNKNGSVNLDNLANAGTIGVGTGSVINTNIEKAYQSWRIAVTGAAAGPEELSRINAMFAPTVKDVAAAAAGNTDPVMTKTFGLAQVLNGQSEITTEFAFRGKEIKGQKPVDIPGFTAKRQDGQIVYIAKPQPGETKAAYTERATHMLRLQGVTE